MFYTEYRGERDVNHGILTVRRPSIPAPEEIVEENEIPGRNGVLVVRNRKYRPITIPVEFNFLNKPDSWQDVYRIAKKWLKDSGKLRFSDDADHFYKCYYPVITDVERTSRRLGNFTTEFRCDPFCYMDEGEKEIPLTAELFNPGFEASPIYRITGEGNCTLTVNGYEFTANVGQEIIIDTEKQIAYKNDGTFLNTDVTGDYERIWLSEGENSLSVSSGFTVSITPRWREL